MGLVPVASSNIAAVGYDGETLTITFKSGGVYTYAAGTAAVHAELLEAESKGRYFHQHVRGHYAYEKLEVQP
jgi:hypothetical protein